MISIQENIILAPYTTFKIGGLADYFVIAKSAEDLKEAIIYALEHKLPFFVLGLGANILIGDKGYRGLVIKNEANSVILSDSEGSEKDSSAAPQNDNFILLTAESGATIESLIKFTSDKGLSGLEHFVGIPSTLGGALWQNLHFLSPDRTKTVFIGNILLEAEILTPSVIAIPSIVEGEAISANGIAASPAPRNDAIRKVNRDYFHFDYDQSALKTSKDIVLSATLKLIKKDKTEIEKVIEDNLKWRMEKHPDNASSCSAGSIFKKIENYGAGRLIEKVGLKGKQIGGAQISEKHANFIINTGSATASDVRELISLVQEKVKQELGLTLETEISFVGEF